MTTTIPMGDNALVHDLIGGCLAQCDANGDPMSVKWRKAADVVINYFLDIGHPFSSGEVASVLRTFSQDLMFQVESVGSLVRDHFDADELRGWEQVSRFAAGPPLSRTPPGQLVYVYAPDFQMGNDYEFEVDIPDPRNWAGTLPPVDGAGIRQMPTQAAPTPATPPTPKLHGLEGNVQVTGRLNIPAAAFAGLAGLAKVGLTNDTEFYVWTNGGGGTPELYLAFDDPGTGAATQKVQKDRYRTLIRGSAYGLTWSPGETFPITFDTSGPFPRMVVML